MIGLVFGRTHPADEVERAQALIDPDVLGGLVAGLVTTHAITGLIAVGFWPNRAWVWVWVATAMQLPVTLVAGCFAGMAVSGNWL